MSITTVTTRITRQYLERKSKSDLAQMYLDMIEDEERLIAKIMKWRDEERQQAQDHVSSQWIYGNHMNAAKAYERVRAYLAGETSEP